MHIRSRRALRLGSLVAGLALLVSLPSGVAANASEMPTSGVHALQPNPVPHVDTGDPLTIPEIRLGEPWQTGPLDGAKVPSRPVLAKGFVVTSTDGIAELRSVLRNWVGLLPSQRG